MMLSMSPDSTAAANSANGATTGPKKSVEPKGTGPTLCDKLLGMDSWSDKKLWLTRLGLVTFQFALLIFSASKPYLFGKDGVEDSPLLVMLTLTLATSLLLNTLLQGVEPSRCIRATFILIVTALITTLLLVIWCTGGGGAPPSWIDVAALVFSALISFSLILLRPPSDNADVLGMARKRRLKYSFLLIFVVAMDAIARYLWVFSGLRH